MSESLSSISDEIEDLFGVRELPRNAGVLHVTALSLHPEELRTIAIDEHSPQSKRDTFALQLGRARADVIIITGKLLRDEPRYDIRLPETGDLRTWRKKVMDREEDPELWVLTRSGDLDPQHPIWNAIARPVVFTGEFGARQLEGVLPGVERIIVDEPSMRAAIEAASARGATSVVLEAGPSTTRDAHREGLVDELMLSLFHGPFDPKMNETSAPFDLKEIEQGLPEASPLREHVESSGRWSFQRRWRELGSSRVRDAE
jgi:riboflavin biosynthesis pyrimidine reductase